MKKWWSYLKSYLYLLWPPHQTQIVQQAYQAGRERGIDEGVDGTFRKLAEMNRQQRRQALREIVKEYGD